MSNSRRWSIPKSSILNPNPVTCLLEQSKPSQEHRHSDRACWWNTWLIGLGLKGQLENKLRAIVLSWRVLGKARSFNPVKGICRLCLLEKYFILFNPKIQHWTQEMKFLITACRQKWNHTLRRAYRTSCPFFKKKLFLFIMTTCQIIWSENQAYIRCYLKYVQLYLMIAYCMKQPVIQNV